MPEFYKRQLPETCIDFSSGPGRALFDGALAAGTMESFFRLMPQFQTQNEPAYCGLATLSMSLNALQVDPGRIWKGVWRWYDESLLDCCKDLEAVRQEGITFDEFVCLARCNGCSPVAERAGQCSDCGTLDAFRAKVLSATTQSEAVLALSYSRRVLGQSGDGHFSPVGGYHAEQDMVLLLDVARFKYPPHWVALPILFDAMLAHDKATDKPRGWVWIAVDAGSVGNNLEQNCSACRPSKEEEETAAAALDRITFGHCPNCRNTPAASAAATRLCNDKEAAAKVNSKNERDRKERELVGAATMQPAAIALALVVVWNALLIVYFRR